VTVTFSVFAGVVLLAAGEGAVAAVAAVAGVEECGSRSGDEVEGWAVCWVAKDGNTVFVEAAGGVETEILRRLLFDVDMGMVGVGIALGCGAKMPDGAAIEEDPAGLGSIPPWGRGRAGGLGEAYIMEVRAVVEVAEGVGEVVREEGEEEVDAGERIPSLSATDFSMEKERGRRDRRYAER
jgi:hypothetical protein